MAIRHNGVSKNTGSNVIVIYRSLPDAPNKCLVLFKDSLPDTLSTNVLTLVNGVGQKSLDLYDVMDKMGIVEGRHMLTVLHNYGLLKPLQTNEVVMHVGGGQTIRLDELNSILESESKINDGKVSTFNPFDIGSAEAEAAIEDKGLVSRLLSQAAEYRAEADKLHKRAMELDPSLRFEVKTEVTSTDTVIIPEGITQAKAIELVKKIIKERKGNE